MIKTSRFFSIIIIISILLSQIAFIQTVNASTVQYTDSSGVILNFDASTGKITGHIGKTTTLEIPDTIEGVKVTSIGDNAFYECSIKRIIIPNSVTNIGVSSFALSRELEEIILPNSLTTIGNLAFDFCDVLKELDIPNNVKAIGDYAFECCLKIKKLRIPDSAVSVSRLAFLGCDRLTDIEVSEGNPEYSSIDGVLVSKDKSKLIVVPEGKDVTNYIIPKSVTEIGEYAFENCGYNVDIFSSGIKMNIPNNVTKIDEGAFKHFGGLREISIPASVDHIGKNALDCLQLKIIDVDKSNPYYCSLGGVLFDKGMSTLILFPRGACANNYTIPNGVTTIGDYAFHGNLYNYDFSNGDGGQGTPVVKVTIPESVIKIGEGAFTNCGMEMVDIPDSVKNIGSYAFKNTFLKSVDIPNNVINIGDYVFEECRQLKSITIKGTRTKLGFGVFNTCGNLSNIAVSSKNIYYKCIDGILYNSDKTSLLIFPAGKKVNKYEIPDSVRKIGENAFSSCSNLKDIILNSKVTDIGYGAFSSCTGLICVSIPNSVTQIGSSAFSGCYSLVSTTLSNQVKKIEDYTFNCCYSLKAISIPKSVSSIGTDAFYYCDNLDAIYGSAKSYAEAYAKEHNIIFKVGKLPTAKPATPKGLSLTIREQTATLTWHAVKGASLYVVYYKKKNEIYKFVSSSTTNTRIYDLSASTRFYFKVTAVNIAGESKATAEISKIIGPT